MPTLAVFQLYRRGVKTAIVIPAYYILQYLISGK